MKKVFLLAISGILAFLSPLFILNPSLNNLLANPFSPSTLFLIFMYAFTFISIIYYLTTLIRGKYPPSPGIESIFYTIFPIFIGILIIIISCVLSAKAKADQKKILQDYYTKSATTKQLLPELIHFSSPIFQKGVFKDDYNDRYNVFLIEIPMRIKGYSGENTLKKIAISNIEEAFVFSLNIVPPPGCIEYSRHLNIRGKNIIEIDSAKLETLFYSQSFEQDPSSQEQCSIEKLSQLIGSVFTIAPRNSTEPKLQSKITNIIDLGVRDFSTIY